MTEIVIYRNERNYLVGFEVSGHTDYKLDGDDILCACISTLCSHTMGAISEFCRDACENTVDEKIPKLKFFITDEKPSKESELFLLSFASSIEDLEIAYPDNIKLTYKGK